MDMYKYFTSLRNANDTDKLFVEHNTQDTVCLRSTTS